MLSVVVSIKWGCHENTFIHFLYRQAFLLGNNGCHGFLCTAVYPRCLCSTSAETNHLALKVVTITRSNVSNNIMSWTCIAIV